MPLKCARLQRSADGDIESLDFGDVYFQTGVGMDESRYVFIDGNRLPVRFAALDENAHFSIGELGFGTGLNFLLTVKLWCDAAPKTARLDFVSFEKFPVDKKDLSDIYARWPEFSDITRDIIAQYPPMTEGLHRLHLCGGRVTLSLFLGDAKEQLPKLDAQCDAWFLDGFSPAKNPDMWEDAFYPLIAARTRAGGTLATFSVAGHMRRGLKACGFSVDKIKGFGVKWSMTVAQFHGAVAPAAPPKKIAVIGAGIAGASVANALARRGAKVTVYDRHSSAAGEASGNPVGIIYPKLTVDTSPMGEYYKHAFCYTHNLLEYLQLPSWRPCGVLRLDLTADDAQRTQKLIAKQEPPADLAIAQERTAFGPSALYHETAGYLDPRAFCAALLSHENITTVLNSDVKSWRDIDADIVILATANAAGAHVETAFIPLQPLRGQISYVRENEVSQGLKKVICHKGYIAPAIDGLHCIGATFQKEPVGAATVRPEDHAENIASLNKNLQGFDFDVKDVAGGRTAWRATTPDKLPIAGKIEDRLYVSTGYGAHGLCGAPWIGEILAAEIYGDPSPCPAPLRRYLSPDRFR